MLTADCVIFAREGSELYVLLVKRGNEPCKGMWALPGGFMDMDETLEECARRELLEETCLRVRQPLTEVGSFSTLHRDPRGRTVTVAYAACVPLAAVSGGDDASEARWKRLAATADPDNPLFPIGLPLAFDHNEIVRKAFCKLFRPHDII
ncbi:MAG: NUDIX hydrolase [Bacteroidales bacterium]|nr:NUDIX hydrolase [Bacteroidales bacterium]